MKKAIKKVLLIALIYSLGIGIIMSMCARAEQIDNAQKKELSNPIIADVNR